MSRPDKTLLEVSGLKTYFPFGNRWFGKREWVKAVDGVDLYVKQGEVLGLAGESGSGKTTLGRSVLRLVEPTGGAVRFDGVDLMALTGREIRPLRRRMQIIFQDPYRSLSPRMQIKQIIAEPLRLHQIVPDHKVEQRVIELLGKVGLEPYFMHRYPQSRPGRHSPSPVLSPKGPKGERDSLRKARANIGGLTSPPNPPSLLASAGPPYRVRGDHAQLEADVN